MMWLSISLAVYSLTSGYIAVYLQPTVALQILLYHKKSAVVVICVVIGPIHVQSHFSLLYIPTGRIWIKKVLILKLGYQS